MLPDQDAAPNARGSPAMPILKPRVENYAFDHRDTEDHEPLLEYAPDDLRGAIFHNIDHTKPWTQLLEFPEDLRLLHDQIEPEELNYALATYGDAVAHPEQPYEHDTEYIAEAAAEHIFDALHEKIEDTDYDLARYDDGETPTLEEIAYRNIAQARLDQHQADFASVLASDIDSEAKGEQLASIYTQACQAAAAYADASPLEGVAEHELQHAVLDAVQDSAQADFTSFRERNPEFDIDNALEITGYLGSAWEQRINSGDLAGYSQEQVTKMMDDQFNTMFKNITAEHSFPKQEEVWHAIPTDYDTHDTDSVIDYIIHAQNQVTSKASYISRGNYPGADWQQAAFQQASQDIDDHWEKFPHNSYLRSEHYQSFANLPGIRSIITRVEEYLGQPNMNNAEYQTYWDEAQRKLNNLAIIANAWP